MSTELPAFHNNNDVLILWNEASQKWQDVNNDFWCKQIRDSGKWRVSARNTFGEGVERTEFDFDHQNEAMQFFVNFLADRRANLAESCRRAA